MTRVNWLAIRDILGDGDAAVLLGRLADAGAAQAEIVIEADPGAAWRITTTHVRTERTEWGINASGETYGAPNKAGEPDLIAIAGPHGENQYGRADDLKAGPANPDQAAAWMQNGQRYAIATYAVDGRTIVGTFEFADGIETQPGQKPGEPGAGPGHSDGDQISIVVGSPPPAGITAQVSGHLTITDNGCVHLGTSAGRRWLILPWGVRLAGTPDDGELQTLMGAPVADLNSDASFIGEELPEQQTDVPCGTDLPPLYVPAP